MKIQGQKELEKMMPFSSKRLPHFPREKMEEISAWK